jgi:cell division GTPase FtsZ
VVPIVTCQIEGARYAVVNVNTFDDVDRSQLAEAATNFEGETTEDRLARRRRNWTPEGLDSQDEG